MRWLVSIFWAAGVFFSSQSLAFDIKDSLDEVIEKISQLDCSKDVDDCRYYGAIEYLSFAWACPVAYNEKTKTPEKIKDDEKLISKMVDDWQAIQDPKIKKALFAKSNPFRDAMNKETLRYLRAIPVGEVAIECTRVQYIQENKNPEDMSELLRGTKNYR